MIKKIKAILFVVTGVVFLFVNFYSINYEITHTLNDYDTTYHMNLFQALMYFEQDFNFKEFIKPNLFNYIFSVLFISLGCLEFLETKNEK